MAKSGAVVSISPANGSARVKTDHGVTVTVAHGKIQNVSVATGPRHGRGHARQDQTAGTRVWPLTRATRYTVTVTAVGTDGKTTTATSTFKTEHPAGTFTRQHHPRPPDLRRRHPHHDQLQPGGGPQVPGQHREGDRDQELQAGRGRLVLGRRARSLPRLPDQELLAAAHQGELRRALQRGRDRPGCVRHHQPEPVVHDRQLAHRRDQHPAPTRPASTGTTSCTRPGRTAAACRATTPPTGPT